jgi:hypothetical protein
MTEIFGKRYILYIKKGGKMDKQERGISIDEMKEKLAEFGNKAIWQGIERIGYWKDRVAYRQVFFLAGGSLEED